MHMDEKELELLIPSETVREYIIETGWTFTDREKAALLVHRNLLWKEECSRLKELADKTGDEELCGQITGWLEWHEKALRLFQENNGKQHIYVLKAEEKGGFWDGEYLSRGYFFHWEEAFAFGEKRNAPFEIEKYRAGDVSVSDDGTCSHDSDGFVRFDGNGEICDIWSDEIPDFCNSIREACRHFSQMFFELPNPFEKGDIVKFHSGHYGIVDTSRKEWKERTARCRALQEQHGNMDLTDSAIGISTLEEDGTFGMGEAFPIHLERYRIKDFNDPLGALLDTASLAAKGECELGVLFRYIREYRKHLNA